VAEKILVAGFEVGGRRIRVLVRKILVSGIHSVLPLLRCRKTQAYQDADDYLSKEGI
jgi:hypothetical protein